MLSPRYVYPTTFIPKELRAYCLLMLKASFQAPRRSWVRNEVAKITRVVRVVRLRGVRGVRVVRLRGWDCSLLSHLVLDTSCPHPDSSLHGTVPSYRHTEFPREREKNTVLPPSNYQIIPKMRKN